MLAGEGEGTRKRSVDDHALFRRTSRGPYWLADLVLARDFQHRQPWGCGGRRILRRQQARTSERLDTVTGDRGMQVMKDHGVRRGAW